MENELEKHARLEKKGTLIDELERLARQFDLVAEIQETTVEELGQILAEGSLPIVYLDRAVFALRPRERPHHSIRNARIHTVIPTQVTTTTVTFHDPRVPAISRKSIRLFRRAYESLGGRCVVCSMPAGAQPTSP